MKQEDVIRMARSVMEERGGSRMDDAEDLIAYSLQLATLVLANTDPQSSMAWQEGNEAGRLAEREACAKVCEDQDTYGDVMGCWLEVLATKIRARGQA